MFKLNNKVISKCNLAQPRFKERYLSDIQAAVSQEFSDEIGKIIRRKMECPSVHADFIMSDIQNRFDRQYKIPVVYHYFSIQVESAFYKKNDSTLEKSDSTGVIGIHKDVIDRLLAIFYGRDISIDKLNLIDVKENSETKEQDNNSNNTEKVDETLENLENQQTQPQEQSTTINDNETITEDKNLDIEISNVKQKQLGQAYFLLSRGEKFLANTLAQLILDAWVDIWQKKSKITTRMELIKLPEGADVSVKEQKMLVSSFNLIQTQKDLEKVNLGSISIFSPIHSLYPIAVSRSKHGVEQPAPKSALEWSICIQNNLCISKVEISAILSLQKVALAKVMALKEGDIIPVKLKETVLVKAAKHELCKAKIGVDHAHLALEVLELISANEAES